MTTYTYKLHRKEKKKKTNYMRDELEGLTTLQLREVCFLEDIAIGKAYLLNREFLIETILKYRGYYKHAFIEHYDENKYSKFKEIILSKVSARENEHRYSIPTKINIFLGANSTDDDNIRITDNDREHEANVLLIDRDKNVRGILNLRNVNEKYYLIYDKNFIDKDLSEGIYKNFSLGIFTEESSKYAFEYYDKLDYNNLKRSNSTGAKYYEVPAKLNMTMVSISELIIKKVETTDNVLVIDFGTSNTSAGVYENGQIREVKFSKTTKEITSFTEIIPTVVGIKSCINGNIVYEFGYEALEGASKNSYNSPHSVFYGIKKWVNNFKKKEEVTDKEGNHAIVSRSEILKAYLLYIIDKAETSHKCKYRKIHITSPIKQKMQFLKMYDEVLKGCGYDIELNDALDEGIAVLYNSISNQILHENFDREKTYKALVIDCGGGTTDLTSCNYKIADRGITYILDIVTTYANGETNFGGNSLTFRLFQYLKVFFANYYTTGNYVFAESLFDTDTQGIYRFIDECGVNKLYESLQTEYEDAEEFVPTKFNEYKYLDPDEFMKIKSNFYFLWNLAEKIKLQFYQTLGRNITDFHENGLKLDRTENKLIAKESWRINVLEDGVFKLQTKIPQVAISKEEVDLIIKGDIYYVIKKFIEPLYENGDIDDFDMIKLTGQTCKIDIFRDALKEFIAGRHIQANNAPTNIKSNKLNSNKNDESNKQLKNFKLSCLEGAIKYQNAHKIGEISPTIINESPTTPYELIGYSHSGEEVVLMSNFTHLTTTYGFISKNIDTKLVELYLRDGDKRVIHKYDFTTDFKKFKLTDYAEIHKEYGDKILQTEVDQIDERELKIFTVSYDDNWGFYVVPIARNTTEDVYIGEKMYYPFENDEWEINYFDGEK